MHAALQLDDDPPRGDFSVRAIGWCEDLAQAGSGWRML